MHQLVQACFQVKTLISIKSFEQLLIWSKLCGKSVLVTYLWSTLHMASNTYIWFPSVFYMFFGGISNNTAAHIILCFRSICIQTVAFWLYLTFIQQFGASYPVLPSPAMCYTKKSSWFKQHLIVFLRLLLIDIRRKQYLCKFGILFKGGLTPNPNFWIFTMEVFHWKGNLTQIYLDFCFGGVFNI